MVYKIHEKAKELQINFIGKEKIPAEPCSNPSSK